jgi:hypothetical protein
VSVCFFTCAYIQGFISHMMFCVTQAHDYQFCAEICQQLVSKSHTIGWQVVQDLGQCHEFSNLRLRCDLLAFALLYCPVDVIEVVVNTRSVYEPSHRSYY